jgi:hypothetical protein
MLATAAFIVSICAFIACVWYAVTHEDLTAGQNQSRLGPLSRALRRVRRRRSSPK